MPKNIKNNQKGVTILVSILILSSVVILALAISDIVGRANRNSRDIRISEVAYFAAEKGVEEALYSIERERTIVNLDDEEGTLDDISEASWSREMGVLDDNEATGMDCTTWQTASEGICVETNGLLWVKLTANHSFQLELDFDGLSLPNILNFDGLTSENASTTIWTMAPSGAITQTNETPDSLHINNDRISLRANNRSGNELTFSISPSGGNIPLSILITSTGTYLGQTRKVEVERKNWQIY